MNRIARDFISQESRDFSFKIGRYLASALTGFVTGVVAASIIWLIGLWYLGQVQGAMSQGLTANQNRPAPTALPKTNALRDMMPPAAPTY